MNKKYIRLIIVAFEIYLLIGTLSFTILSLSDYWITQREDSKFYFLDLLASILGFYTSSLSLLIGAPLSLICCIFIIRYLWSQKSKGIKNISFWSYVFLLLIALINSFLHVTAFLVLNFYGLFA